MFSFTIHSVTCSPRCWERPKASTTENGWMCFLFLINSIMLEYKKQIILIDLKLQCVIFWKDTLTDMQYNIHKDVFRGVLRPYICFYFM